jgi:hypothetical protein
VQTYSVHYYTDRCKARVDAEWKKQCEESQTIGPDGDIPPPALHIRNKIVAQIYNDEDPETKKHVRELMEHTQGNALDGSEDPETARLKRIQR